MVCVEAGPQRTAMSTPAFALDLGRGLMPLRIGTGTVSVRWRCHAGARYR